MNTYSYVHMFICSYIHIKRTRVLRTHVCTKIFLNFCCALWRDGVLCSQERRKGATYRIGNEVTKLSILFNDGSQVDEIFASKLKSLLNGLAKENTPVNFRLNVQGRKSVSISCNHSYAYEHLSFIDELDSEILAYGVAIVVATDCRTDKCENTIFVVCDDEL